MAEDKSQSQIAVIGAGPGGIAAAIQLKRFGLSPLVFEKGEIGGLLRNAHWVENYPGFPCGISGPDLAGLMKLHLESLEIPVLYEDVLQVDYRPKESIFDIITNVAEYDVHYLVLACGTRPKKLKQAEGLPLALREKIFYEVHPILHYSNKHIVVVGAGDAAFDYALNLAQSGDNHIDVVFRGDEVKALPLLHSRCLARENIHLLKRHRILSIGEGAAGDLSLSLDGPGATVCIECDILLAAIGREVEKEMASPRLLDLEEELMMRGLLYLAGDVKNDLYRQASIAVGNGIEAAMRLCRDIKE